MMLGNTIALLTLALMLASEGKRTEGIWRPGLYTLAVIVGLIALALEPIARELPAVGTTLSAIFGNPLAWFVLLMGLFFVLRPFWAKRPPELSDGDRAVYAATLTVAEQAKEHGAELVGQAAQLREAFDAHRKKVVERLDALEAKDKAIIQDYQRMLGLEVTIEEGLAKLDGKLTLINATYAGEVAGLKERIENLGELLGLRIKQAGASFDSLSAGLRQRFDNVDDAFLAISHLEWTRRLGAELVERADALASDADKVDSNATWEEWADAEDVWRTDLDQLLMIAETYLPGTTDKVRSTEGYENAHWEPHNPSFNGGQVRRFQDFVIRAESLKKHREKIEKAIYRRAFLRPSMKGEGVEIGP